MHVSGAMHLLKAVSTTVSETQRNRAYTGNQPGKTLSGLVPWVNPTFSSVCCLNTFKWLQVPTTKFPFSCRIYILHNWLEMSLHPCNTESPGRSRCFHHAVEQTMALLWSATRTDAQGAGGSGRRCWTWSQSTAVCVSFISLPTLSWTFTSPHRVWEYNLFYLSERRHLAHRRFLLTGLEEGTCCCQLSLTFTVYRRDSL